MRPVLIAIFAVAFYALPATAQPTPLEDSTVHPCGFRSPSIKMARAYLKNNFDSLTFRPGERIADIGAQSGNLAGILSLFYDRVDMTLEDIDTRCLNPAQVRATLRYYYNMREQEAPKNFKTRVVIGTETSTTLPSAAYAKVFFMNTYHEVSQPDNILAELHRITAPGGMLYVSEKVSTTKAIKRPDCGHRTPIEHEMVEDFTRAGFRLEKRMQINRYRRKGDWMQFCCFHFRKA